MTGKERCAEAAKQWDQMTWEQRFWECFRQWALMQGKYEATLAHNERLKPACREGIHQ